MKGAPVLHRFSGLPVGAAAGLPVLLAPLRMICGLVAMAVTGAVLFALVGALGLVMLACGMSDPRPVLVSRRRR
ncbi:MAG: hypothetical protein KatS3mg118_2367 [Paracoccaceae bacterium]|nr:MAG: hypothetical protein D6686_08165 [Alphaproteobacteria bacterium]GIX14408.1 MAG: hypothetical protein KatS3mg118_2367 [Paracoccaceae bacterium]